MRRPGERRSIRSYDPLYCNRDGALAWSPAVSGRPVSRRNHRRSEQEALMSDNNYADNLSSAVRYALRTTGAITVCPFHCDVTIRVGDAAAECHAFARARNIIKTDGTKWKREALMEEFTRQLSEAAEAEQRDGRGLVGGDRIEITH